MSESAGVRSVPCELFGAEVSLPLRPARIVSLVSGLTEALFEMGLGGRVVGISKYCRRYVDAPQAVVVGDYLRVDESALRTLQPDLVLLTTGVQRRLAERLRAAGWPVYLMPLPSGLAGILENIRYLGALTGEMASAEALAGRMWREACALRVSAPERRPSVYVELWFGRHQRTIGGVSFIHDIVDLAGGRPVFADTPAGYLLPDLHAVEEARPEVVVVFSEEDDHPVNGRAILERRGWYPGWGAKLVESGIRRGRNFIHDGPSLLDTAHWFRGELLAKGVLR